MERGLNNYSTYRHTDRKRRNTQQPAELRSVEGRVDPLILFCTILLVLFGILMVFSATYYMAGNSAKYGYDSYYYLKRNLIWSSGGLVIMAIASKVPYKIYKNLYWVLYGIAVFFLVLVLLFGEEVNGAKRWIFGFQPSELAKVCVILFLAEYIERHKRVLYCAKDFAICVALIGIPIFLIAVENLSTAIVLSVVSFGMLFIAGAKIGYFVPLGALGALAVAGKIFLGESFRQGRISAWLDPFADVSGTGYQVVQSLYAIASGGIFGLGIGQSRQKMYMPEAHNDIIFAIICEELGLVGAGVIVLLFVFLIYRCARTAMKSCDMYGMLVAGGVTLMIATQVAINLAVVTNSMPNTGIPLPFISYGGTSMLIMMGSMGVVLNISKYFRD